MEKFYNIEQLEKIGCRIFQAAGVPDHVSSRVSASLVESNLCGHDSHGLIRIPQYLQALKDGRVNPQATLEILNETPTTALIDAHWAFGQIAASKGMEIAIEKAQQNQVSMVALRHCYHVGRIGEYAQMASDQGLIGTVMANSGPPMAAAYGGMERLFAPNPISWAVPTQQGPPFVLDYATTACAEGKLNVAKTQGERVPDGWILDKEGNPSTDPADFYDGGLIQPFGGHRGYALCLLMDILGGVLTGHGATSLPEYKAANGVVMMAINIEAFTPLQPFLETVDRLFDRIKSSPAAPGFSEVLIPGEPESRTRAQRLEHGIPVHQSTWSVIAESAKPFGLDVLALVSE